MTFDADPMRNGQRAVVGRIEHVYLAVGGRRGKGGRQVPAGRRDVGAVIGVAAGCRDEGAGAPAACAGTAGSVTASASAAAMKIVRVIGGPLGVA